MKTLFQTFLILMALTHISPIRAMELPIYEETLPNGLRLIVVTDTTIPEVSCRLYYFVGSMHEGPGTTGLSHMFEHMMFKGTQRLGTTDYSAEVPLMDSIDQVDSEISKLRRAGYTQTDTSIVQLKTLLDNLIERQRQYLIKDEIWHLYEKNGGTGLNAWTSDDMTAYIVTLPANKVELFANIEADRMQNVVLREFVSERDVVTEERRMRYENRPVSNYFLRLESLFYTAHPYRNPTIGWESDIQNYSTEAMRTHIQQYYRPDNALIILAGNIAPQKASALVQEYFGSIPSPTKPMRPVVTREPKPLGEVRFIVREKEAEARIDILYHTPGFPDSLLYPLEIVETMLSGVSGRLHKRLVEEEKLCLSTGAGNVWRHHNGQFHIWGVLQSDADHARVEKIILEEIDKLTREEPQENELIRVKNQIRRRFLEQLQHMESFSDQLAFFEKFGHWKNIYIYEETIATITQTSAVVSQLLQADYRTVGYLINTKEDVQ